MRQLYSVPIRPVACLSLAGCTVFVTCACTAQFGSSAHILLQSTGQTCSATTRPVACLLLAGCTVLSHVPAMLTSVQLIPSYFTVQVRLVAQTSVQLHVCRWQGALCCHMCLHCSLRLQCSQLLQGSISSCSVSRHPFYWHFSHRPLHLQGSIAVCKVSRCPLHLCSSVLPVAFLARGPYQPQLFEGEHLSQQSQQTPYVLVFCGAASCMLSSLLGARMHGVAHWSHGLQTKVCRPSTRTYGNLWGRWPMCPARADSPSPGQCITVT